MIQIAKLICTKKYVLYIHQSVYHVYVCIVVTAVDEIICSLLT